MNPLDLLLISIFGGLGAYFGSYLREKGKNLATREDVDRLVRKTEEIKADVSGDLWVKQKRWDVKLQSYSRLVENLGELVASLQGFRGFLATTSVPTNQEQEREFDRAREKHQQAVSIAVEQIRRSASIARLVIGAQHRTRLSSIADMWNETGAMPPSVEQVDQRIKVAHDAWNEVLDAARADLGGPK